MLLMIQRGIYWRYQLVFVGLAFLIQVKSTLHYMRDNHSTPCTPDSRPDGSICP